MQYVKCQRLPGKHVIGNNSISKKCQRYNLLYNFNSLFVSHVTQFDSIIGKGEKMQQEYNICPNKLPHTIYWKSLIQC